MMNKKPTSVDEYIATFPLSTQRLLIQLRNLIRENAPNAEEVISYGMPAYRLNGILVYFAGYENHIGFYPTGKGIEHFEDKLKNYKSGKGSIQFPINEPLLIQLIREIVNNRLVMNMEKQVQKSRK